MNKYVLEICDFWKNHKPQFVKINKRKLSALAKRLTSDTPSAPDWKIKAVLPESPIAFVSQTFYICAIDFAFTHFEAPYEKFRLINNVSGSTAASMCFYRCFGENPASSRAILKITSSLKNTEEFFQGLSLPPLIEKRRENLYEAATMVKYYFNDNPLNIIKETDGAAAKLIDLLITAFPLSFGSDYYQLSNSKLKSKTLFINKRAQLWPLIYQGRALYDRHLTPLKDPENIGPVADYQIPKYLKSVEILKYHPLLEDKIKKRQLISYGSLEEIEIRCATVYAVCELMKKTKLTMPALDYFLWSEGQKVRNSHHHLTKTTAY